MLLITVTQQLLNTFRPFLHKRDVSVSARNLWDIGNMADRTKASEQLADYAKSKKVGSRSFCRGSVVLKTYLFTLTDLVTRDLPLRISLRIAERFVRRHMLSHCKSLLEFSRALNEAVTKVQVRQLHTMACRWTYFLVPWPFPTFNAYN